MNLNIFQTVFSYLLARLKETSTYWGVIGAYLSLFGISIDFEVLQASLSDGNQLALTVISMYLVTKNEKKQSAK